MRISRLAVVNRTVNPRKHEGLAPLDPQTLEYLGQEVTIYRAGNRPLAGGDYVTFNRQVARDYINNEADFVVPGPKQVLQKTIPPTHLAYNGSGELIYAPPGWKP